MELRYPIIAIAGLIISIVFLVLFVLRTTQKDKYKSEIKLADANLLKEDTFYKQSLIIYAVLKGLLIFAVIISITVSFALLARPYYLKKIQKEKYNRDIMICIDISSSVNDLNLKLVKELQDTVRSLNGERVGIVMFNTSPVLLSPLSDDYEYTIQQLENIRTAIKKTTGKLSLGSDWLIWDNFLYGGTLVGNEERGSSLIGDGLLGGLINFPEDSKDRTKIIIFATDNDKNGDGYVTLTEAADYCKKKDVVVYGIGTELMYPKDEEEMRKAMEATGGKFFLEENAATFGKIVDEIESRSASLVQGSVIIKEVESPEKLFTILIISTLVMIITSVLLRRYNLWFVIGTGVAIVFLTLTYILAIIPAHNYSNGSDFDIKRNSDYKVLFVVDDTISMLSNDGGDGRTRMEHVKEDVGNIIDQLDGARFSVISFNNTADLKMPFNNNGLHAKNVVGALYPLSTSYAKGTSSGVAADLVENTIKQSGDGKTAVFYISDGEITNDKDAPKSFSAAGSLVSGGAVLGYGTAKGGTMSIKNTYDDGYTDVMDYTTYPYEMAVSKMDEDNLKKIANELNVPYVNMTSGDSLSSVLNRIKADMDVKEEIVENTDEEQYIKAPQNNSYWLLVPVIVLFVINGVYIIKKR